MSGSHLLRLSALAIALSAASASQAATATFTKLTGLTGNPGAAATAVYKADLSTLGFGTVQGISITDNSGGTGGSPGQFSGFDLDAIKLSLVDCADAACAASAAGISVFDFLSGTFFAPGTQRAPVDAKLFGTGPAGNTLDDAVARLSLFDGFSSTVTPDGFISLGDTGKIGFNLTSAVSTTGLFLYIGEVGDNGEVAASAIDLSQTPFVPEPETYALMLAGLAVVATVAKRRARR
jgi:hypothetical protein